MEGLLKVAHVEDLLTEVTMASNVEASKPEPDIVQAAVTILGLTPSEVLIVGDASFDIESARKAGVDTVALRCGGDHRFAGAVAGESAGLAGAPGQCLTGPDHAVPLTSSH